MNRLTAGEAFELTAHHYNYHRAVISSCAVCEIEEVKMIKNKYVAFVLYIIVFFAFWNLADYLYTTFITGGSYHFSAGTDGALPAAVAIVSGYLLFVRKNSD